MSVDLDNIRPLDIPYRNLVLTGFLGVGKTTIGRYMASRLGIEYLDVDEEIVFQEVLSIAKIRELYGDSRLKALEHEFCRHAALMRRSVIIAPGAALLDERNFQLFADTAQVLVLTCQLGEALRRMHLTSEQHYRDLNIRRRMLSRLRREYAVVNDTRLLQLDTTALSVEETARLATAYWFSGEPQGELFRYGPPPPVRPPDKMLVGISGQGAGPRRTP
jgi:shikimate kinase